MKHGIAIFLLFAAFATLSCGTAPRKVVRPSFGFEATSNALLNLEFAKVGNKSLKLDLYYPADERKNLPLFIYIHGGGFRGGDKRDGLHHKLVATMLSNGYAAACVNYRFSYEAVFPAAVNDCKGAVRFLRANADKYGLNPDKFVTAGESAGGYLVAMLGLTANIKPVKIKGLLSNEIIDLEGDVGGNTHVSSGVQAVCPIAGPCNFISIVNSDERKKMSKAPDYEIEFMGAPIDKIMEKAKFASPINHVTADAPPFLLVHGTADPLVPLSQSEELYKELKKNKVEAVLYPVKNGGHVEYMPTMDYTFMVEFFNRNLKTK